MIRKYFYVALLIALFGFNKLSHAREPQQISLGPNIVSNSGFEDGSHNWHISSAEIVDGISFSGEHSLHYTNTNNKQYKLFLQEVNVHPGQRLHFSAWIKGENIAGPDSSAAGVFMQSYSGSSYINSASAKTQSGSFNWHQFNAVYLVPENATRVVIGLYLRKGVTGTVWFDDVEVREEIMAPFFSNLQYPNYRGMLKQNSNLPWKVIVGINKQKNWKENPVTVIHSLADNEGKTLWEETTRLPPTTGTHQIIVSPPKNLRLGSYTLSQTIIDPNGVKTLHQEYAIQIVKEMPKVYIDNQGFTVVEGKRFFPLGLYLGRGTSGDEHLERITKGGFNTILSYTYGTGADYDDYLDRAQKHQLKVIYAINKMYPGYRDSKEDAFEIAARYIRDLRDKPALLAWYTNDEMNINWLPKLKQMYEQVKHLDPNHPAFQVQNKIAIMPQFFDVTDVLAADPYPVGLANLTQTSANTRLTLKTTQNIKGMWIVPQLMDWGVQRKTRPSHQPTLDEMRNQAYQAIINGATGLIFYSYYDLMYEKYPRSDKTINMDLFEKRWKDAAAMSHEINALIPAILHGNTIPLLLPQNSQVEARALEYKDDLLILLANPYYQVSKVTLALPEGWKVAANKQGEITCSAAAGKMTFTLPSVGSGVFRLKRQPG